MLNLNVNVLMKNVHDVLPHMILGEHRKWQASRENYAIDPERTLDPFRPVRRATTATDPRRCLFSSPIRSAPICHWPWFRRSVVPFVSAFWPLLKRLRQIHQPRDEPTRAWIPWHSLRSVGLLNL